MDMSEPVIDKASRGFMGDLNMRAFCTQSGVGAREE